MTVDRGAPGPQSFKPLQRFSQTDPKLQIAHSFRAEIPFFSPAQYYYLWVP